MARPKGSFKKRPDYRLHRPSGRGVVTLGGKDVYLIGAYGSDESKRDYARRVGEFATSGFQRAGTEQFPMTVSEVLAAFWNHHQQAQGGKLGDKDVYYLKQFRPAAKFLRSLYGDRPARSIGPLAYRTIRAEMLKQPHRGLGREDRGLTWSRSYVNSNMGALRFIFKWAASFELVPPSVPEALSAVEPIMPGRGGRELAPVAPAEDDMLRSVIAIAPPTLKAMLQLQELTGARPGEVIRMRGCDIQTGKDVWIYRPHSHKTKHLGRQRVIPLGPRAMEIVQQFLTPKMDDYLFKPSAAKAEGLIGHVYKQSAYRREITHRASAKYRAKNRNPSARINAPRPHYSTASYGNAIKSLCRRVYPVPDAMEGDKPKVVAWRIAHSFHPNMIRHTYATKIRAAYGIEMAKQLLGHSRITTTEIYAEPNLRGMTDVASKIG